LSFADKLLFESDSSTLAGKSHAAVEKIGKALIGVGIERLRVEGHTDNVGSDAYNNKLSLARAEAVAGVLNSTGIASSNLTVRGLGKSKPVADNATPAAVWKTVASPSSSRPPEPLADQQASVRLNAPA